MCIWYRLANYDTTDIANKKWYVHQACSELAVPGMKDHDGPIFIDSCSAENIRVCEDTYQIASSLSSNITREVETYCRRMRPAAIDKKFLDTSSKWRIFQRGLHTYGPKSENYPLIDIDRKIFKTGAELTIRTASFSLSRYQALQRLFTEFEHILPTVSKDLTQNFMEVFSDAKTKLTVMSKALQYTKLIYESYATDWGQLAKRHAAKPERDIEVAEISHADTRAKAKAKANVGATAKTEAQEEITALAWETDRKLTWFAKSPLGSNLVARPCNSPIRLDFMLITKWDPGKYRDVCSYLKTLDGLVASIDELTLVVFSDMKNPAGPLIFEIVILFDYGLRMCYRSIAYLRDHGHPDESTNPSSHTDTSKHLEWFLEVILSSIQGFFRKFNEVLEKHHKQEEDYKQEERYKQVSYGIGKASAFFQSIGQHGLGASRNANSAVDHNANTSGLVPSKSLAVYRKRPAESMSGSENNDHDQEIRHPQIRHQQNLDQQNRSQEPIRETHDGSTSNPMDLRHVLG